MHEAQSIQSINQASAKLSWANYLKGHGASFLSECRAEASETAGVTRSESGLELGTLGSIERGHTTENPWKTFQNPKSIDHKISQAFRIFGLQKGEIHFGATSIGNLEAG